MVKLNELFATGVSRYREILNFIQRPGEISTQRGKQAAQERFNEFELPLGQQSSQATTKQPSGGVQSTDLLPAEHLSSSAVQQGASNQARSQVSRTRSMLKPLRSSDIPLLPEDKDLRGRRGKYRRVGSARQVAEQFRLYDGILVFNHKPVLIKEYLLSERYFNAAEARQVKDRFATVANLNLKAGVGQDFRMVAPWDTISPPHSNERCCYSITEPIPNSVTLKEHLTQTAMSANQVRSFLSQVLQTLWFLHHQRVRLPSGELQPGIAHGNLNLESVLIAPSSFAVAEEPDFLVYLTDLALWEDLFVPGDRQQAAPSFAQDLKDLGAISVHLLSNAAEQTEFVPRLTPSLDPQWLLTGDRPLKQFTQRLLRGEFKNSAEDARQELLHLEPEAQPKVISATGTNVDQPQRSSPVFGFLLALGLLTGLIGLAWVALQVIYRRDPILVITQPSETTLAGVQVPSGKAQYLVKKDSIWGYVLKGSQLASYTQTLEQELRDRKPVLQSYVLKPSDQEVTTLSQLGSADFALTSAIAPFSNNSGLTEQVVAYDGLGVFVAFSDALRDHSIPTALKGKITLEQLRQIYTGKLTDAEELADNLRGYKIVPYIPFDDPQALELFKQLVLRDDTQEFDQRVQREQSDRPRSNSYNEMLAKILESFETAQSGEKTVAIGFGLLSKLSGQCAVYPLAVAEKGEAVQPLVQKTGQPITPETNLCNAKGSYALDPEAFASRNYPLSYRLSVVYLPNNQAGKQFGELLKTDEGQYLLSQVGLVPMKPLPKPQQP